MMGPEQQLAWLLAAYIFGVSLFFTLLAFRAYYMVAFYIRQCKRYEKTLKGG